MSSIFHYTSNQGALGIIASGCLFSTNYRYMSDRKEISLAKDIIVPFLRREFEEAHGKLITEDIQFEAAEDEYGKQVYDLAANAFFDTAIQTSDELTPVFITSFCRHAEGSERWRDGLLSQWRAYGAAGGCALEFYEHELHKLAEAEADSYTYSHVSLCDIRYHDHEQAFDTGEIEGAVVEWLRYSASGSEKPHASLQERLEAIYRAVASIAPTLKSSSFQEECEFRIVAAYMRSEAAADYPDRKRKSIEFRFRSGSPVPYIRLFEEVGPLPIRRIIVGPQPDQDNVAYALELALEQKQMVAEIAKSSISFLP